MNGSRRPSPQGRGTAISRTLRLDGSFARSVLQVTAGTALAQIITIAASPVLTRLYSPEDFGVYAAASTITSLVIVISSLRYAIAIPLPADEGTAACLIVLCGLMVVATAGILAIVLALFGGLIADLFGTPGLVSVLWIVVLAELGGAMNEIVTWWATRDQAFGEIAKTRFVQGLGMASGQIGLAAVAMGPVGLVLGDAFGRTAGTWRLARAMWRVMRPAFMTVTRERLRATASLYRRFPIYSVPGGLLDAATTLAPTMVLLSLYGPVTGGLFALAQRVGGLPVRLIAASYAQVYFGLLSRQMIIDPSGVRAIFLRSIRHLSVAGLVPTALLAASGLTVFPVVFGANWRDAGVYLAMLSPMWYLLVIWNPVSGTLGVLQRQRVDMFGELIALSLVVGAAIASSLAGVSPAIAVLLIAMATSLATLTKLAITWLVVRRISSRPLSVHRLE